MTAALFAAAYLLLRPDPSFRAGVDARAEADIARRHFREAATKYAERWNDGERRPALAANRLRAEALAGNLPAAMAAAHAGLRETPTDAGLQADLELLRNLVPYARGQRPPALRQLRHRLGQIDLWFAFATGTVIAAIGTARAFTSRPRWALPVSGVGFTVIALSLVLLALLERERRMDDANPLRIVSNESILRRGNGEPFAPVLEEPIPPGAEVRTRHARGGWLQVELADGTIGWLPEADTRLPE